MHEAGRILSVMIVVPDSMFAQAKAVIVFCVKSGMTSMRARPASAAYVPERPTYPPTAEHGMCCPSP
jgi:hypothetical protein